MYGRNWKGTPAVSCVASLLKVSEVPIEAPGCIVLLLRTFYVSPNPQTQHRPFCTVTLRGFLADFGPFGRQHRKQPDSGSDIQTPINLY